MESSGGSFLGTLFYVIVTVAVIAGWWKIFEKAGKPGWAILIPIYNFYIMTQICGKQWWWVILMLLFPINIIFIILIMLEFLKRFGQPLWHIILMIFIGFIYIPWLGFGPATYRG